MTERPGEVIRLLDLSKDFYDINEGRNHITGLQHALRTAELLEHREKNNLWFPFMGLVHDLARPLNDIYHGEIMAEIVRDRVPGYVYHVLRTHGLYQEVIMHNLPTYPIHSEEVKKDCKPYNLDKIAMMFAACEELSFKVDYEQPEEVWTYERAKEVILTALN